MKNKENLKSFSIKKLLLTILCTIVVSTFIGTTILFIFSIPNLIRTEIMIGLENDSELLIEIGKSYEENWKNIEQLFNEQKAQYGEDYPAEGIFLFKVVNISLTQRFVNLYSKSLLIGIALGTIIYIIAIQNIKGKKIVIELIVAFVILFIFVMLLNLGYEAIINKAISEVNSTGVKYSTYIYDLESNNVLIQYIIVAAIIYIINIARQKILTNKLNKELNKE